MARLSGEVEDDLLATHERLDTVPISDIGDVDPDPVADVRDIALPSAVLRDQRVHQDDLRPCLDECSSKRRPDEAEPSGNEHPATSILGCELGGAQLESPRRVMNEWMSSATRNLHSIRRPLEVTIRSRSSNGTEERYVFWPR